MHGSTQRLRVNRPLSYILKYASKGGMVEFPKGLRIHGCGGLNKGHRDERTWWLLPKWVRSLWTSEQRPRRAKGGGYVVRDTSEWYPSIWKVYKSGGAVFCVLRDDLCNWFSFRQLALILC